MEPIALSLATSAASALIGAIVAALVASVRARSAQDRKADRAMRDGMKCLLRQQIIDTAAKADAEHGLNVDMHAQAANTYAAYTALGGNSFASELYEHHIKNAPVIMK